MKFLTALFVAAPFGMAAAASCTTGTINCGLAWKTFGNYTDQQLSDAIGDEEVAFDSLDVGVFVCGENDELAYEGSYCLCECANIETDDPNEMCTPCSK